MKKSELNLWGWAVVVRVSSESVQRRSQNSVFFGVAR